MLIREEEECAEKRWEARGSMDPPTLLVAQMPHLHLVHVDARLSRKAGTMPELLALKRTNRLAGCLVILRPNENSRRK
jgi:hypothetical protein